MVVLVLARVVLPSKVAADRGAAASPSNLPGLQVSEPNTVASLPLPDASTNVVPVPSSRCQSPIGPAASPTRIVQLANGPRRPNESTSDTYSVVTPPTV